MEVVTLSAGLPPETLDRWQSLAAGIDVELEPYLPPMPLAERLQFCATDELSRRRGWLALEDGDVVGYSDLHLPLLDNRHLALLYVGVAPTHRRRGIARVLARRACAEAASAQRRTLLVEAVQESDGAAVAAALGGHPALASTPSVLDLRRLDRELVEAWTTRRSERARGYSLVRWIGRCPDPLVDAFADLRAVMDTAPKGDLDITIESSAARVRGGEAVDARLQHRRYVICAAADDTGELVGVTDITVPGLRPTTGYQEDTVVRPAHRNKGLGRWLKAEMLTWLAQAEPQLEQIATWNATENDAMRSINTELGFAARQPWHEWQFDVRKLLARLG